MKKIFFYIPLAILLQLSFSPVVFSQPAENEVSQAETKTVKAIEVKGNKTISIATVLSKIKIRVGQDYIQSVVSDDIKRLYNTGYFADVRVEREDYEGGTKVIIFLEEKSIVEEITLSKTRYISAVLIKKKIKTHVGKFLDSKVIQDDIATIKELYVKKGLTKVEVEVEKFIDEVTNKASLHFVIREGQKVRVKRINVFGNHAFNNAKILKVVKSRKKWLFNSGYLKEEILEEDMGRISSFYEQNGFIDITSKYEVEYLNSGLVDVTITIDEGKRYYVGNLKIDGTSVVSEKEVEKSMEGVKQGGIFSREKLTADLANIRTLYFDKGYIFANVNESTALDPDTGKVDVDISVEEGSVAYIEKVKIQGNTRTRDIVIRRELKMYPGDKFDGGKLKRSKERLSNLGYFEDVSFDIEDTDTHDRKDLLVQVKEAKTGTFSFGGGFSTVDQIVGFIEIEQRNFDFTNWPSFTGGGQQLEFRAETGSSRNNLRLSFTEPWIFDHPVSGGFDVFKSKRDREQNTGYAYDEERLGGDIRFGKEFSEFLSGHVIYKLENVDISNFESNVSAALLAEEGSNTVSSVGFSVKRDARDSGINPTKGLLLNGGVDIAGGLLGFDKDFYRTTMGGSYYIPLKFKSVLEMRVRSGFVNAYGDSENVPIFERFFAGGARSIRGYDERGVGPQDSSTKDPVGGESMLVANVEYTIPLIDFLKLAAFFDAGNVWSDIKDFGTDEIKSGTGLGLRVKTPIGPINLDYGYPLSDEPGKDDKTGKFYFSVSRGF